MHCLLYTQTCNYGTQTKLLIFHYRMVYVKTSKDNKFGHIRQFFESSVSSTNPIFIDSTLFSSSHLTSSVILNKRIFFRDILKIKSLF